MSILTININHFNLFFVYWKLKFYKEKVKRKIQKILLKNLSKYRHKGPNNLNPSISHQLVEDGEWS